MTTIFDAHKNLAYSTVATAPSPATSGTSLVLAAATGALFPAPPFNAVCWPSGGATASQSNAEFVRVTAISTDTLTIIRAQEGSTAQSIAVGWQLALTGTAKVYTDIEAAINATLGGVLTGTLPSPGLASGAVGTAQLASGAVTQLGHAYGATSGPATTSTSYVDLPDMAVTLTTTGGDLLAWLQCDMSQSTSGDGVALALSLDGAPEVAGTVTNPLSVSSAPMVCVYHWTGVAAGGHTVKGRWEAVTGGTATANVTRRSLVVAEVRR